MGARETDERGLKCQLKLKAVHSDPRQRTKDAPRAIQ
jgi:hypothetical protein